VERQPAATKARESIATREKPRREEKRGPLSGHTWPPGGTHRGTPGPARAPRRRMKNRIRARVCAHFLPSRSGFSRPTPGYDRTHSFGLEWKAATTSREDNGHREAFLPFLGYRPYVRLFSPLPSACFFCFPLSPPSTSLPPSHHLARSLSLSLSLSLSVSLFNLLGLPWHDVAPLEIDGEIYGREGIRPLRTPGKMSHCI
jgi:hypothetical protein